MQLYTNDFKDYVLNELAEYCNIAQFVSYSPSGKLSYKHICNDKTTADTDRRSVISELLEASAYKAINIRTFKPEQWQGNPFITELIDVDEICKLIDELQKQDLYIIVHESIDIHDGGISCVLDNGALEFVCGDTPRFVEKVHIDPIPRLKYDLDTIRFLGTIYEGMMEFENKIYSRCNTSIDRIEFSLHPKRCGVKHANYIVWEVINRLEQPAVWGEYHQPIRNRYDWPNSLSRYIGDKAYGLLVADHIGMKVPRTTWFSLENKVDMFTFGTSTGSTEMWTRSCPSISVPGKYTTVNVVADPYSLMHKDNQLNELSDTPDAPVVSCLIQSGVAAKWSGACLTDEQGDISVEGVGGYGDGYMQGSGNETLPIHVIDKVTDISRQLECQLNSTVRFEWVYDGYDIWIVQLHIGAVSSSVKNRTIYPIDKVEKYIKYNPKDGLDTLRELCSMVKGMDNNTHTGIVVCGNIGMSSHIADILRKEQIGSYIDVNGCSDV